MGNQSENAKWFLLAEREDTPSVVYHISQIELFMYYEYWEVCDLSGFISGSSERYRYDSNGIHVQSSPTGSTVQIINDNYGIPEQGTKMRLTYTIDMDDSVFSLPEEEPELPQ